MVDLAAVAGLATVPGLMAVRWPQLAARDGRAITMVAVPDGIRSDVKDPNARVMRHKLSMASAKKQTR